jgi:hypothetical protein
MGVKGSTVHILDMHIRRMQSGWLFDENINADMWLLQQQEDALCAVDRTRRPSLFLNSYFFVNVTGYYTLVFAPNIRAPPA